MPVLTDPIEPVYGERAPWSIWRPTSNKLTPADGFDVPVKYPDHADILDFSVGTDPGLALETRCVRAIEKI